MILYRESFLHLISRAVKGQGPVFYDYDEDTWKRIYQLAKGHKLESLLYETAAGSGAPEGLLRKWKQETLESYVQEINLYNCMKRIISELNDNQIPYVVFKGCVLAEMYPQPFFRKSGDMDLFVEEKDIQALSKIFSKLGYENRTLPGEKGVVSFQSKIPFHRVELHISLWEGLEGPRTRILDHMNLTNRQSRICLNACGMQVVTLGYEEHFIYLLYHMMKHFMADGMGIRFLIDIVYYVNLYWEKINWNNLWKKLDALGMTFFVEQIMFLCREYFSMHGEPLKGREIKQQIEEEKGLLLEDILTLGIVEGADMNIPLKKIIGPYLTGELLLKKGEAKEQKNPYLRQRLRMIETYRLADKEYN